jgi:6-phosphofructokinase 1
MKRIAILTAGGDTPALNATLHGAVARANQLKVETIGLLRGFDSLYDPRVPHVRLNPLFSPIPELDPNKGGSIIGSSRTYVDASDARGLDQISDRLKRLAIDGLVCVGGDGTLNGLQPLCDRIPTVLAPKTIDNDLGLNYPNEPDKWLREDDPNSKKGHKYLVRESGIRSVPSNIQLEQMVNYCTPGYATAVYVAVEGISRIRTTAESHRRVAIVEVMGRNSGYIALGTAYGQADIILVPEAPIDVPRLVDRVKEIYELQRHAVIACGEGIVDEAGNVLGDTRRTSDPSGNVLLSGAAERLRQILVEQIGDDFFRRRFGSDNASTSIFTRKVGHTQRGGRPLVFDRFNAAQLGGRAVDMLLEGQNNSVAILQWNQDRGFYVSSCGANSFRDKYGVIHARTVHPSFYNPEMMNVSQTGVQYLLPIFRNAIGYDDVEHIRDTRFDSGNLYTRYHSVNADMEKRMCYLE